MKTNNPFYWLNEDSRTFLERGYLLEGETPEDRIRQIGEKAEQILNMNGFAEKFYDYMSRGFYSLSSPIWSNFGRERGLPIS
ncbi:MAG: ribonucleotide reductase N-terminal alpha domain-containing protein, partial [Flavobacteriaceae bacterium]